MTHFDLLLVDGRVVDPLNKIDGNFDVGVADGKVKMVKSGLDRRTADKILDLHGKTIISGVIDSHMHAEKAGYRMMAKVGVVTGIDFSERADTLCENVKERGSGMNIATLANVRSYGTAPGTEVDQKEIGNIVKKSMQDGALGVKITGGHNPFTPDTTRKIIEVANQQCAYVAFHVGTTATGSNLNGLKEAVELAGKNSLHVAHVNSYLRGLIKDPVEESLEGLAALRGKRNIASESYLAIINGTGGKCTDGKPDSHVTRNCLRLGKYPETQDGLEKAILKGWSMVQIELGGECVLVYGQEGVKYWKDAKTDIGISFPVNVPASTFLCATRKDDVGQFIVQAISTDGGSIPRNVSVSSGLSLVRYGGLTFEEFVRKVSLNPARMYGMMSKGHLSEGADADITVLDLERGEAVMAIAKGQIIMIDGVVIGSSGTIVTTKAGAKSVQNIGLKSDIVDLEESTFYHK
jgi:cytosine/adenosine deaminase-related metal-dependent hydrolase